MKKFLNYIINKLPIRPITIEGDLYLARWYIAGRLVEKYFPGAKPRLGRLPISAYLHWFARPDRDRELHNHPWKWSFSVVLSGSYTEERRHGREVRQRRIRFLNIIRHSDFHRVSELHGEVWTLFIAGPKVTEWGFWDRDTNQFILSKEFFAKELQ